MKVTEFMLGSDGEVTVHPTDPPRWQTYAEEAGQPLTGVQLVDQGSVQGAEFQLVRIVAGGSFAMHASDDVAFCQIVSGEGILGLPRGRSVPYEGPELFIFRPGTLHEWRDVTVDTLLSVCLVRV